MAPFTSPSIVLTGFKERAESLTVQGDRLYVGTSTGNLHIYALDTVAGGTNQIANLVETTKALSRRALEQLGYIKDVNALVVLSDSVVTLYTLPTLSFPTPLAKTKGALSFAIYTGVVDTGPSDKSQPLTEGASGKAKEIPTVVTHLAIGCKRKIVQYSWRDGEPQEVQETSLPHSPRGIAFLGHDAICFGYGSSLSEYAVFSFKNSYMVEVVMPVSNAISGAAISNMSMGALSGLGGYMRLGAKAKPCVVSINDQEALVANNNNGIFVGVEAKATRSAHIDWPAPPDELAFLKPYIFSLLPSGSVPMSQIAGRSELTPSQPSFVPSPVVEIRSSLSSSLVQMLPFPPVHDESSQTQHIVRLLTSSPAAKSSVFLMTAPADRSTATAVGSTIWQFRMKPWSEQIDELVEAGSYSDALALVNSIDDALLPDKEPRQRQIRALHAVSQFRSGEYDAAINAFIDLDINPAKVIALYPGNIAGRLSVPQDDWIELFGGPAKPAPPELPSVKQQAEGHEEPSPSRESPPNQPSPHGSITIVTTLRAGLEATMSPTRARDVETASTVSKRKERPKDTFHKSVETLMRYLSDRRPKVSGALEALGITSAQSHQMSTLSSASIEDLFSQPNVPLSALTPEELVRFAQIVDTALFKSYLLVRPGLLAPLCRVGNWCEVSEVEEVLRAHEKYSELIFLYNGKKMHTKALNLLRELSEKETDMREKLTPSVNYLQRLGPEYLEEIFSSARWIFEQDADIAFEIFTSEEVELPRQQVVGYLEKIDPQIAARYIEYLIKERGEVASSFHDRLAEIYLRMTQTAKQESDEALRQSIYSKLLHFIDTTNYYHTDRLYAILPSEGFDEAKAVLLGKLGRHDNALEIYVYRLQDFHSAEEYCKRVYRPDTETSNIFLTLLRIYLQPTQPSKSPSTNLLQPALELISRHSPRLDPAETLNLLPPLVTAQDVEAFLCEALRAPIFDTRVIRGIAKARQDEVARKLMYLETRRVKVTDSRICPQCHKRIGHSVIAVHTPRGEVTHYQCREAFSRKLKETRV
ncbi:uncharacterized protein LAESUDRAFT_742773 [Laetiporus sulphureus 93-53]|uniref:CNH domain-containing protein n=1 Tax=Laetiporus sulphureus 93-53 TaxID=1314785 RepID=A0A165ES82_9APHY|nr:uncharacterized protein LAESUDRAFT_742773 [Laetiporus sulphureus 93-53]KZT07657.1 hypothetical protein LAESUDRAFT_742773 [Laetiporus sulphureus 93-53]